MKKVQLVVLLILFPLTMFLSAPSFGQDDHEFRMMERELDKTLYEFEYEMGQKVREVQEQSIVVQEVSHKYMNLLGSSSSLANLSKIEFEKYEKGLISLRDEVNTLCSESREYKVYLWSIKLDLDDKYKEFLKTRSELLASYDKKQPKERLDEETEVILKKFFESKIESISDYLTYIEKYGKTHTFTPEQNSRIVLMHSRLKICFGNKDNFDIKEMHNIEKELSQIVLELKEVNFDLDELIYELEHPEVTK